MSAKNTNSDSGGTDVLLVLQLIFLVLKLCNVINWSWWAVLIPTWISLFILLVVVIFLTTIRK